MMKQCKLWLHSTFFMNNLRQHIYVCVVVSTIKSKDLTLLADALSALLLVIAILIAILIELLSSPFGKLRMPVLQCRGLNFGKLH
eukprot:scaffold318643_cov19-Prasinocladus_malaysianus.AAC.1